MPLSIFLIIPLVFHLCSPPEPVQVETDEDIQFLNDALRSGYEGRYRSAALDLQDYLEDFPRSLAAREGLVHTASRRGEPREALRWAEEWIELAPGDPRALQACAEVLIVLGRYEEAEARLKEAVSGPNPSLESQAALSRLLYETGRREEARRSAEGAISPLSTANMNGEDFLNLARLYRLLGDLDRAAQAAVFADERLNGRKGPNYRYERYESLLELGEIYLVTRLGNSRGDRGSGNRALSCYLDALKIDPNLSEALLGLARARFYASRFKEAHEYLDKILDLNPVHAGALAWKAHLLTLTREYDEAKSLLERGLSVNPRDKRLLAQQAAIYLVQGESSLFESKMQQALEIDPCFGEGYFKTGEILIYHFRFSDAEKMLRMCLSIDADYSEAYIQLARALANLGLEKEARAALEESLKRDPFDYPWRENMLKVLDELDTFLEVDEKPFQLVLDVEEASVIQHYLFKWGGESLKILEEQFQFTPAGPLLMEMFPDHQDFAVRTIGFTGLGALGACFGRVVTLLSPRAAPFRGSFNWACTLHHELCHVVTLQMSRSRIPRWFTEGLSVYEEGARKRAWRRNLAMDLFNNFYNDRLFDLDNIDRGFMGPRVLFAYYQAGLIVTFIVERYGIESLREMILAYGKDLSTAGILRRVLGSDPREFEALFHQWIHDTYLSAVALHPYYDSDMQRHFSDLVREDPENIDLLLKAAWACHRNDKAIDALYYLNKVLKLDPENLDGLLLQGSMANEKGDEERAGALYAQAVERGARDLLAFRTLGMLARRKGDIDGAISYMKQAKDCFPALIEPGSPRFLLIQLYQAGGRDEDAIIEMEELVDLGFLDLHIILKLAQYYSNKEDHEKAVLYFTEAIQIDPFLRDLHTYMAGQLRQLSRLNEALDELDLALKIDPKIDGDEQNILLGFSLGQDENSSLADIHAERAAVFLDLGRREEAASELDKALQLRPDHARAQELKKKLPP